MRDEFDLPNEFENEEIVERASCLPGDLHSRDRKWLSWGSLLITSVAVVIFFIALSFLPVEANRTRVREPEILAIIEEIKPEPEEPVQEPEPEPEPELEPEPEPEEEPDQYASIVEVYDPRQLESFDNRPEEEEEDQYQTLPDEQPEDQREFAASDEVQADPYEIPTIAGETDPAWEHSSFTPESLDDSIRGVPTIEGDSKPRRRTSFRAELVRDSTGSVPGTIPTTDGPRGQGSGRRFGTWPGSGHGSGGEGSGIVMIRPKFQIRDLPAYYQTVAQSCLRSSVLDIFMGGMFGDDKRESVRDWLKVAGEGGGQKELSYKHSGRWTEVIIDSSLALDIDRTEFLAVKSTIGSMSEFAELIEAMANDLSSLMGDPGCVERLSGQD